LAPKADDRKTSFDLAAARRGLVLWRLDGGFGADEKRVWTNFSGVGRVGKGFCRI